MAIYDFEMLPSMVLSNLSIHSSKTGGEMDMNQIARNLICYPRIKMVSAAFAPFLQQNSQFEMNAFAMTSEIFQPGQECCALDTSSGAYFTAWLQYRGDFNPWNIYQVIHFSMSLSTFLFFLRQRQRYCILVEQWTSNSKVGYHIS